MNYPRMVAFVNINYNVVYLDLSMVSNSFQKLRQYIAVVYPLVVVDEHIFNQLKKVWFFKEF